MVSHMAAAQPALATIPAKQGALCRVPLARFHASHDLHAALA
jgi:hypothetical protein